MTVNEISEIRKLKYNTIYNHLIDIINSDIVVDLNRLGFTVEKYNIINNVIKENDKKLSEYKKILGESITYDEIKLTKILSKKNIDSYF